jgi:SAM-dependent methyltransferase
MRQFYDQKIHGRFYTPKAVTQLSERYVKIADAIKTHYQGKVNSVVEVGPEGTSNPKFLCQRLQLTSDQYLCVDISDASVELLRREGFPAARVDVSQESVPAENQSVDVVVISEVIEHLVDPDHAIEECIRVLRPGTGLLVLTTPNLGWWFNRFQLLLGLQPIFTETGTEWVFGRGKLVGKARPVGHLRIFTWQALREFLEFHGMEIKTAIPLRMELLDAIGTLPSAIDRLATLSCGTSAGLLVLASTSVAGPSQRSL